MDLRHKVSRILTLESSWVTMKAAMDTELIQTNSDRLAQRLEEDIRRRGLRTGDRYLTSAEAGRLYGISTAAASRAMRLLAENDVLVRQPSRGTFVGPRFVPDPGASPVLDTIHVLMSEEYTRTSAQHAEVFLEGLRPVLPDANVHIHYIVRGDSTSHTRRVIEVITRSDLDSQGLILVLSSHEAQRLAAESSLPAVVFGSVYPDIIGLPWVDYDHDQAGKMLVRRALSTPLDGRLALIMLNNWRRGDNILFEAVTRELGAAGYGLDSLVVRSIPTKPTPCRNEIHALLTEPDAPRTVLCHCDFYADVVVDVAASLGLAVGRDVCVVSGSRLVAGTPSPYPYISPALSPQGQIETLGRMLRDLAQGRMPYPDHALIPVVVHEPTPDGAPTDFTHVEEVLS